MGLFATMPIDEVTVQDVAHAVEMTPAAVYYHFASKEQILIEGMEQFREAMLAEVRSYKPAAGDTDGVRRVVTHLIIWAAKHRTSASVFFVSSIGLNLLVEAVRRETRLDLVEELRDVVGLSRGKLARAEAGVIAVALVSLLETALASMLNQDSTYRALGGKRFVSEVGHLANRIAGV
jgi:AcrR family transcriptional regulator